jgi:hypothetical protein
VLVQGFDPVDPAVAVGEPAEGADEIVVVVHVADPVVVGEGGAELVVEVVVGLVGDAQDGGALVAQPHAEPAGGRREVGREEDDVHRAAECRR